MENDDDFKLSCLQPPPIENSTPKDDTQEQVIQPFRNSAVLQAMIGLERQTQQFWKTQDAMVLNKLSDQSVCLKSATSINNIMDRPNLDVPGPFQTCAFTFEDFVQSPCAGAAGSVCKQKMDCSGERHSKNCKKGCQVQFTGGDTESFHKQYLKEVTYANLLKESPPPEPTDLAEIPDELPSDPEDAISIVASIDRAEAKGIKTPWTELKEILLQNTSKNTRNGKSKLKSPVCTSEKKDPVPVKPGNNKLPNTSLKVKPQSQSALTASTPAAAAAGKSKVVSNVQKITKGKKVDAAKNYEDDEEDDRLNPCPLPDDNEPYTIAPIRNYQHLTPALREFKFQQMSQEILQNMGGCLPKSLQKSKHETIRFRIMDTHQIITCNRADLSVISHTPVSAAKVSNFVTSINRPSSGSQQASQVPVNLQNRTSLLPESMRTPSPKQDQL